jgi:hypothetical protein
MDRAILPAAGDLRHCRFKVVDLLVERDLPNLHPLQLNWSHVC